MPGTMYRLSSLQYCGWQRRPLSESEARLIHNHPTPDHEVTDFTEATNVRELDIDRLSRHRHSPTISHHTRITCCFRLQFRSHALFEDIHCIAINIVSKKEVPIVNNAITKRL